MNEQLQETFDYLNPPANNGMTAAIADAHALTTERSRAHGDWLEQAALGAEIDGVFLSSKNYHKLPAYQRKALDMIAVKLSRILTGNPAHEDHWDDIAGYAYLGKAGHQR